MMEYVENLKQTVNHTQSLVNEKKAPLPEFGLSTMDKKRRKTARTRTPPTSPMNMSASNNRSEERLGELPRSYLADGVLGEVTAMKNKLNGMQHQLESVDKAVRKVTDEKMGRIAILEKKIDDDLESFKIFKERVQLEVDILKERNKNNMKTSQELEQQRPGPEPLPDWRVRGRASSSRSRLILTS
jgi:hypothetical protein